MSISTNPETYPTTPLGKTIKVLLDPEQSEILSDLGEACFAVIGRASHPGNPKRWVLHVLPTSIETANQAVKVAKGELRTVKPRTPKP